MNGLYIVVCNAPGHNEEIISMFSPDKPFTVYDEKYWWSDRWSPLDFGKEYDFSRPFFRQFRELLERVPLINLSVTNMSNSYYCNVSEGDKDCYLISASEKNERVIYSNRVTFCKDSSDIYIGNSNELCYDIVNCNQCFRVIFSRNCIQCIDSAFLYNCTNCSHCFGCANLRNKSYYFFNKPCTKEEYEENLRKIDFGSFQSIGYYK